MRIRYRNVSFLAEVLVNIMVFSISCSILVGAFAAASNIARKTREESLATNEIYAVVETAKLRGIQTIGAAPQADGTLRQDYNAEWQPVPENGEYYVSYTLLSTQHDYGTLQNVTAVAYNAKDEEICRFETALYYPDERGSAA